MLKIAHRINTIEELSKVPKEFGLEIDLRANQKSIILHHEPFQRGPRLEDYLDQVRGNYPFIVFNIKSAGIEEKTIKLAKEFRIKDYFLLDVEFPFIYRATREGIRKIAIRYSEDEPIEQALLYKGKVDWMWIDTNTTLPLDKKVIEKLNGFKTCLVSPDRWGRPQDIPLYKKRMEKLNFQPTAVMTSLGTLRLW